MLTDVEVTMYTEMDQIKKAIEGRFCSVPLLLIISDKAEEHCQNLIF